MRTAFLVAVILSVGCGASVDEASSTREADAPVAVEDSAATVDVASTECTCVPTMTQDTSCVPHAACTGASACADIEPREAAKQDALAQGSEHCYFQGEVPRSRFPSDSFTADRSDCAGSTVENVPETLRVRPYDIDGCRCEVSIVCDRVRTTTLACTP